MKNLTVFICMVACCAVGYGEVKRTDDPVNVDGKLNEAIWKEIKPRGFVGYAGKSITNRTTIQMAYDATNLYIAFVCYEKQMDKLRTEWCHHEERDNAIWQDDCVEILLDPLGRRKDIYHIIVNTAGVIYDVCGDDTMWDANLSVGIQKHADRWVAEIAIPFEDLGLTPQGGEVWRGNLCREEKPHKELSTLFMATNGFKDAAEFGEFRFEPSGGNVVFGVKKVAKGKLVAAIHNSGKTLQKLCVSWKCIPVAKNTPDSSKEIVLLPGKQQTYAFPYPEDTKGQAIEVKVESVDTGKLVYQNRFPLPQQKKASDSQRVWKVENPLYKELQSEVPMGLIKDGALFWSHGRDHNRLRQIAMQYGFRYVYDEFYQRVARHKLRTMTNGYCLTIPSYDAVAHNRRHNSKEILHANRGRGSEFRIGRYPFFPDPAVVEEYVHSTDEYLTKYGDVIWAVMAGDEIFEHDEKVGVKLLESKRDEYEFIRKADQEIKDTYGGGVYGMPTSLEDKNPYRWIAYRRWLNDKYFDTFQRLYKRVKEISPQTYVVSMDPIAFHRPYDFSRWSQFCDIMTHQLYPRRNKSFAKFGFLTKLIADISGMQEVWPCAHVEEYAASFTPQEVVELVSQVFRNGGTGLHYYHADTVGRRKKSKHMVSEFFGAPDRWQVEMALLEESRKMNKLRFPKADCAILYSCDSYSSQPPGTPSDEAEILYMLIGPNAGSWFKFIDDNQIDRGTVDLSAFKVVYIPFGQYQRRKVVDKLVEYVRKGGTLVALDPMVFSTDVHGKDISDVRQKLFGVEVKGGGRPGNLVYNGLSLSPVSRVHQVSLTRGTRRIAQFKNSWPAIVARSFGKGRTYYFASNPCMKRAAWDEGYKKLFKAFQRRLGLKTDQDIWRFQFPMDLVKIRPLPQGRCLTNNYIHWTSFNPLSVGNVSVKGTYSYSLAPDNISDQGGTVKIPFDCGDLTDRRKAPAAGNVDYKKSKLQDWVVRYSKPDPFKVTFDFGAAYPLKHINVFYSHFGQLPGVSVEGSVDGATWVPMGIVKGRGESARDVHDVQIPLSGDSVRYLRLNFGERTDGKVFTLCEVEVWAK